jgi:hypothetical protein
MGRGWWAERIDCGTNGLEGEHTTTPPRWSQALLPGTSKGQPWHPHTGRRQRPVWIAAECTLATHSALEHLQGTGIPSLAYFAIKGKQVCSSPPTLAHICPHKHSSTCSHKNSRTRIRTPPLPISSLFSPKGTGFSDHYSFWSLRPGAGNVLRM